MTPRRASPFPSTRTALVVGGAALLLVGLMAVFDPYHALRAYLLGWYTVLGIPLGAMAINMIHHLTGGRWGWPVRRPAEAAGGTLPFVAVAFVPLAFLARLVFPWADRTAVSEELLLRHRAVVFNVPLTLGRAVVFFCIWSAIALMLRRWSARHDATGDEKYLGRLARVSAAGLVIYFITMSLASIDWIAAREVDWYSSTFGVVAVLGQAVSGLALLIVVLAFAKPAHDSFASEDVAHDLGNLFQTAVVLWAYVSFMQYLVIWSGNTQEDLIWFHHRDTGGWRVIGIALIALHFALPFVLLLFQRAKRNIRVLGAIAAFVLGMRCIDAGWLIIPSTTSQTARSLHWLDPIAVAGALALWWTCFRWQLRGMRWTPRAAHDGGAPVSEQEGATARAPSTH